MKDSKMFKSGNYLQFEFRGKTVKAEVVKSDGDWIVLFGKDVGSSWFKTFKKDWLLKNAIVVGGSND